MKLILLALAFLASSISAATPSTDTSIKATVTTYSGAAFQNEIKISATIGAVATSVFVKIELPATAFMANNVDVSTATSFAQYVGAVECGGSAVANALTSFAYTASTRLVHLEHSATACAAAAYSVVLKGVLLTGPMIDNTIKFRLEGQDAALLASTSTTNAGTYGALLTGLTAIAFTPTVPIWEKDNKITISFTPQVDIIIGKVLTVTFPGISTLTGSQCSYGTTEASAATTAAGTTTGYFTVTTTAASGTGATTLVCTGVTFLATQNVVTNGAGLAFGDTAILVTGSKFMNSLAVVKKTATPTAAFSASPANAATSLASVVLLAAAVSVFV